MSNHVRIAISGKSGCGNSTVSQMVAEKLGVRLINYTFRTVAEEKGIAFEELRHLAEKDPSWDRYVDTRQVELAREGDCVLGSRLAVWLLDDADLKVYLTASERVRAERIVRREGGNLDDVIAETRERDKRDRERYMRLYGIDNDAFAFVDIVIDTEDRGPEAIADLIVDAIEKKKTPIDS